MCVCVCLRACVCVCYCKSPCAPTLCGKWVLENHHYYYNCYSLSGSKSYRLTPFFLLQGQHTVNKLHWSADNRPGVPSDPSAPGLSQHHHHQSTPSVCLCRAAAALCCVCCRGHPYGVRVCDGHGAGVRVCWEALPRQHAGGVDESQGQLLPGFLSW